MLQLIHDYDLFKNDIEKFEESLTDLFEQPIKTIADFNSQHKILTHLDERICAYLSEAFTAPNNRYVKGYQSLLVDFTAPTISPADLKKWSDRLKFNIVERKNILIHFRKYILVSDLIKKDATITAADRSNLSIEAIQHLLLEKLNELFDDSTYAIEHILWGNGIAMKRRFFDKELGDMLEAKNLIKMFFDKGNYVATITTTGAAYVEEMIKARIKLASETKAAKSETKNLNDLKEKLKTDLQKDIETTIDHLNLVIKKNSPISDDLISVSGRLGMVERQNIKGIISTSDFNLEQNRIRAALLQLINSLGEEDLLI